MPNPNNTSERVVDGISGMRLLEEWEQELVRIDEAEESLTQARARCVAAESYCRRMQIERWRVETELAQACSDGHIGIDALKNAWDNKHATNKKVEQASQAKAAALKDVQQAKSVCATLSSQLKELEKAMECALCDVREQIEQAQAPIQPQEVQAVEQGHQEPNEAKEEGQQKVDGKVEAVDLMGDLSTNNAS